MKKYKISIKPKFISTFIIVSKDFYSKSEAEDWASYFEKTIEIKIEEEKWK